MEAIDFGLDLGERQQESISRLTMEWVAYVAIGLLAAALRFIQLGLRPLNEAEALQALAGLRFVQGAGQATPAGTIPALFTGNVIGFTLMGASDVTARWLPALAGVILALLPFGLRHRLGRGGALAASLLLAISPSAVYFSRNLDSSIVVAACGLAIIVGLINYVDTHQPAYVYFTMGALGLGLAAGPAIYSLVLILVAFVIVLYLAGQLLHREVGWRSLQSAWDLLRREKDLLVTAGVVLVATFGLVTMTFVLHPAGVGDAADMVSSWVKGFLPEPGDQSFIYPLLLLLRYELLILVLGLVEIGRWVASMRTGQQRESRSGSVFSHTALLVFWTAVALPIVLVVGQRDAGSILLVVVPLALLAGHGVERTWRWISRRNLWSEAALFAIIVLGLAVFLYLQLAAFGFSSDTESVSLAGYSLYASTTYLIMAAVALVLLIGLSAAAWVWRGSRLVFAGGWLSTVLILLLFAVQGMWGVGFARTSDARELMILETTVPEVRLLVERLEALSLQESGDAHTLKVTVDAATGPVVGWYLRDFTKQSVVEGLSPPLDTLSAVTLAAQGLPIGETFRGQGFPLRAHWAPWGLWGKSLVRWLLFAGGALPVVDQEAVLWVATEP